MPKTTRDYLCEGYNVYVSNTFTQAWEVKPYRNIAKMLKTNLFIISCFGNYGNVHNVPECAITKMKNRWENDV